MEQKQAPCVAPFLFRSRYTQIESLETAVFQLTTKELRRGRSHIRFKSVRVPSTQTKQVASGRRSMTRFPSILETNDGCT